VASTFPYSGVALDLDGVIWLGDTPISGSAAAVARLQADGVPVVFVTNMSALTVAEQEAKLARHRIEATGAVVTSAMAAASLVNPGESVLVCGGPGVTEAVEAAGAEAVDGTVATQEQALAGGEGHDAVMVGYHTSFDYWTLTRAAAAVREGARLIGTNHDPSFPTTSGPTPGGGSILAAVAAASETEPTIAGKPHAPVTELVQAQMGPRPIMIGDRADTDGEFATALACDFGLVFTGVTAPEDLPIEPEPAHLGTDLAALVDAIYLSVG
jgi:HAD superfamily hydrolase (TIGR01450 family)